MFITVVIIVADVTAVTVVAIVTVVILVTVVSVVTVVAVVTVAAVVTIVTLLTAVITVGALHCCADVCPSCDHIVASHEYTFRVEGQYQVFPELNNIISIPSHRKSSHLSQLSKQEQITIPQSSESFHSSLSSLSS